MKKILLCMISVLLLTGCGKEEKEDKQNQTNQPITNETNKPTVTEAAAILTAKSIIKAAQSQYQINLTNGSFVAAGNVGELPLDKVYVGTWMLDELTEEIRITNVQIEGYICNGTIESVKCERD